MRCHLHFLMLLHQGVPECSILAPGLSLVFDGGIYINTFRILCGGLYFQNLQPPVTLSVC
jgi:hypothetical protein